MQVHSPGFQAIPFSCQVIRKMDDHFGISSDATSALLSHQLDTERQLDIQILYLRRVHHFCFYSGKWCKDSDSVFRANINVYECCCFLSGRGLCRNSLKKYSFMATNCG